MLMTCIFSLLFVGLEWMGYWISLGSKWEVSSDDEV